MKGSFMTGWTRMWIGLISVLACGCVADEPRNPSFPVTTADAKRALQKMKETPAAIQRPIVVINGFADPGVANVMLASRLRELTGSAKIISVSLGFTSNFDQCRRRIIDAVQKETGSNDPRETVSVDVVGYSMGGLAARYAADRAVADADKKDHRRLRIARLFTISSPLRGAEMADFPLVISPLQRQMRKDSDVIRRLNFSTMDLFDAYPIFSYVRLGDLDVGEANAAAPGQVAWWVPTPPAQSAHMFSFSDPRILADIALRLRNEPPLTTDPPAPLP